PDLPREPRRNRLGGIEEVLSAPVARIHEGGGGAELEGDRGAAGGDPGDGGSLGEGGAHARDHTARGRGADADEGLAPSLVDRAYGGPDGENDTGDRAAEGDAAPTIE